ncbi:putative glycosyltransferase involved in capsule biosynthesis [Neobacillus niacini]|uniref:galactosyltransferase-related protein n=1 Tax=Neobacillus niacini TaxID=86668 RepID=UPI00285C1651|nr:galactosyltransferase-related protein [Neobacillus niacini]MDR7078525.1 putative glycosyltransferase involved in capsule biosynthesis [Neobacillus niacini]
MLERVSIIIPFKNDFGPRTLAFEWIKKFYRAMLPETEICIIETDSNPYNRSEAINNGAKRAKNDIFVIADCDIFYDPQILLEATKLLNEYAWVIPFRYVRNLSNNQSIEIFHNEPKWPIETEITDFEFVDFQPYKGAKLLVVTRENFEKVGGFDDRFIGWGREDECFTFAIDTLCGPSIRLEHTINHCWHPFVGSAGNPNIEQSNQLWWRYATANGNVESIKKIVEERRKGNS